jgi:hypothetical protein
MFNKKESRGALLAVLSMLFTFGCSKSADSEATTSTASTTPSTVVTTLAGNTAGNTDGTGTAASFNNPYGLTSDGTNLFVADSSNHRIRKIVIATGVVTTLAGNGVGNADGTGTAALFNNPYGLTSDGTNLFVADTSNHRIRKIVIATGVVTTLAGNGIGNTNGTGTAALFSNPKGITNDGTNLFVADQSNHRIRQIVIATGVVTTLAGNGLGNTDGTGTAALFASPSGITRVGTNLFVADYNNHRIRQIVIATGVVTTLAGNTSGNTDGTGTAGLFNNPHGITSDGTNLFVADTGNHRIRKIVIASGVVSTLAGNTAGNTNGTGTAALFNFPYGITSDVTNLFVADTLNHRIRKIQ